MKAKRTRQSVHDLSSAQVEYLARLHSYAGAMSRGPRSSISGTAVALSRLGLVEVLKTKIRLSKAGWEVAGSIVGMRSMR